MEEIKDIQKKYCPRALIFAIIIAIITIILDQKAVGKGFILGTFFSIINFIIMGQMLPLKLARSQSKASAFSLISIFLRFIILAVPLIISLKVDTFNFFGVAVGLFSVQLTIVFHHVILNRLPSKKQKT